MKANLTFNLDDQDDRQAHMRCLKASDMASALWDIREHLIKMDKHTDAPTPDEIRESIFDLMEDINFREIWT